MCPRTVLFGRDLLRKKIVNNLCAYLNLESLLFHVRLPKIEHCEVQKQDYELEFQFPHL